MTKLEPFHNIFKTFALLILWSTCHYRLYVTRLKIHNHPSVYLFLKSANYFPSCVYFNLPLAVFQCHEATARNHSERIVSWIFDEKRTVQYSLYILALEWIYKEFLMTRTFPLNSHIPLGNSVETLMLCFMYSGILSKVR